MLKVLDEYKKIIEKEQAAPNNTISGLKDNYLEQAAIIAQSDKSSPLYPA